MIETKGLTKSFGSHHVLDDINLTLDDGKIYGLLGLNGVGKTTLLNILSNQLKQTKGVITLDGETLYENDSAVAQVTMVKESGLGVDLKLKDMLRIGKKLYAKWDQAVADRFVEHFGLNVSQSYSKLSRGQQTLANLILGLASRCRYTFLDEPTLGLDAANRDDFYRLLLEDYEVHPRTIVIATHLIDEGANLFEEVIILQDRRLLLKEEVASLLEKGVVLSGKAEELAPILEGKTVLETEQFGQRSIVSLLGPLSPQDEQLIEEYGIEVSSVGLQKLFVLLTKH